MIHLPTEEKRMTFVNACSQVMVCVLISLALACSSPSAPPKPSKTEATRAETEGAERRAVPPTGASPARDSATPPGSATAVDAPKFSSDACRKDSDCAPVAMCHPDRCAAVANVGSMSSEMMCTMECRGGTVDCGYNHCGCAPSPSAKKVCALLPGPGEKR